MTDYRIEAETKEQWAFRALNAELRNKELTLQLLATSGQAADALAKLTKAVEALRECAELPFGHTARAVLTELEGKE
jgi:hypothetical protein